MRTHRVDANGYCEGCQMTIGELMTSRGTWARTDPLFTAATVDIEYTEITWQYRPTSYTMDRTVDELWAEVSVDEGLPAPPEDYTDAAAERAWAQEINRRAAEDEVLQSQRREALFRENRAEQQLCAWEVAQESAVASRIERGAKISERPVSFTWLHGPDRLGKES